MTSSRLFQAVGGTSKNVGRYGGALLLALLCFDGLVSMRRWHQDYAVSPQWAAEVERKGSSRGWPAVVAAAAETFGDRTFASKELFYDEITAAVKRPKFALAEDKRVKEYTKAIAIRDRYQAEFVNRLEKIDDEFALRSKELEDIRRGIVAKRAELLQTTDDRKQKDLAKDIAGLEASRVLVSRELTNLNAERVTIESVHAKRVDAEDKKINAAESRIRAAIDSGAGFARPAGGTLATFIGEKRALHIGDESDAWHIVYIVVWYGLEALIVLLLCFIVVPWLMRFPSGGSTDGARQWLRNLLGRVFAPRVAAGAGQVAKALMAAAVTATAVVGVAAAAGDQPPVVPVMRHETVTVENGDPRKETKPQGENTGGEEQNKIAAELKKKLDEQATALETQNQTLKDQATLIGKLKTDLDSVAEASGKTRAKADELERDAKQITANVYGLASGAEAARTSLEQMDETIGALTRTTGTIMLSNASATRQLDRSLTRLQLATAATANGAADVSEKAAESEQERINADREIIRASTVRDGWLLPLNPFCRYRVNDDTISIVRRALATPNAGPGAQVLQVLEGLNGRPPEPIWKFERPLVSSTPAEAKELMRDLMPLILKVSRVKGERHGK